MQGTAQGLALPLPYAIPPSPYKVHQPYNDTPWQADGAWTKPDSHQGTWPRKIVLYGRNSTSRAVLPVPGPQKGASFGGT